MMQIYNANGRPRQFLKIPGMRRPNQNGRRKGFRGSVWRDTNKESGIKEQWKTNVTEVLKVFSYWLEHKFKFCTSSLCRIFLPSWMLIRLIENTGEETLKYNRNHSHCQSLLNAAYFVTKHCTIIIKIGEVVALCFHFKTSKQTRIVLKK